MIAINTNYSISYDTQTIEPPVYYFGTPIVLVSTLNPNGKPNITPISSAWALGDRIILGMGLSSQGCENFIREKNAVLNFPDARIWKNIERIARATGRNPVPEHKAKQGYEFVEDKIAKSGLSIIDSEIVTPPRLIECPIQIEVELLQAHQPVPRLGESNSHFNILETRVLRFHAHRSVIHSNGKHIDADAWKPLLYVFRSYVSAGENLGRTFKA